MSPLHWAGPRPGGPARRLHPRAGTWPLPRTRPPMTSSPASPRTTCGWGGGAARPGPGAGAMEHPGAGSPGSTGSPVRGRRPLLSTTSPWTTMALESGLSLLGSFANTILLHLHIEVMWEDWRLIVTSLLPTHEVNVWQRFTFSEGGDDGKVAFSAWKPVSWLKYVYCLFLTMQGASTLYTGPPPPSYSRWLRWAWAEGGTPGTVSSPRPTRGSTPSPGPRWWPGAGPGTPSGRAGYSVICSGEKATLPHHWFSNEAIYYFSIVWK